MKHIKKFSINEDYDYDYAIRNLGREKKLYPRIFEPELKDVKEYEYDKLMNYLETDKERYDLVWDILEYINIYNRKVGITRNIGLTNIKSIMYKSIYNLKEIKHKWMKLSENPNIEPSDIYKDFKN